MSETFKPQPNSEKFKDFSQKLEQTTTRSDKLELSSETFKKDEMDFGASLDHLKIHYGGEVAGSQFNSEIFTGPDDMKALILNLLPDNINYDQFGRAELTLKIQNPENKHMGWSGVQSIESLKENFPQTEIKKEIRTPGGEPAEVDGITGAWYPETTRNPQTGQFEIAKNDDGSIKNPHGKFEPMANVAAVADFNEAAKTDKITLIIQKDRNSGKPTVLTIFPGENAPAFPAKIDSESYKADSLKDPKSNEFWSNHVFVRKTEEKNK